MSDIRRRFEKAAKDVRSLPNEPDTHKLLELYALYKQATVGDVSGPRPAALDVRARAKHDAWEKVKGLRAEEAMTRYVALVARVSGG
jgi:diazepam-binding inhibitor (GABA receptor modulator, acyl-CoA-binding protein)